MKCRPLRYRYVVFECKPPVDDYSAVSAINRELEGQPPGGARAALPEAVPAPAAGAGADGGKGREPRCPGRVKIRVVLRAGTLLLVRMDQLALKRLLKAGTGIHLRCGQGELRSLVAVGSVKKGKEKIKARLASIEMGMKRPSQSIQNSKDVE